MLSINLETINIKQLIDADKLEEAEKKIVETALFFVNQIEQGDLIGKDLEQACDHFYTLFEIQLEKKVFSSEIEELLEYCFTLHAITNQKSKKFKTQISLIKKLAGGIK